MSSSQQYKQHPYIKQGDRLQEILNRENLTQGDLADRLDVDPKTVGSAVRGETLLAPGSALKICEIYGYSLDWIYGVSEITEIKDIDSIYSVDIRDIFKIKNGKIAVSIKSKFFEDLIHMENNFAVNMHQIDEDYKALLDGVCRQRRRFFISCKD